MSDAPNQSLEGVILERFERSRSEPVTAAEIAAETDYSLDRIATALSDLVGRGRLETKEIGGERVWWAPRLEDGAEDGDADAVGHAAERETTDARGRLLEQHRQLAQVATRINVTDDLDEILRLITDSARELVGAHQSVTSRTVNQNWEQAITAFSLSDKYAEYRDYDTNTDGSGIYSVVCRDNRPMRLTQAELEAHPEWNAFGDEAGDHPPMRGWLAVPIVGPAGQNMGLIQLSDKYRGEFTDADEAILVQLANVAAAAIENARLYDELRESEERYRTLFESMSEGYCVVEKVDVDADIDTDAATKPPADFRYVEANPAFEQHVGLEDVVGNTIREVLPGESRAFLEHCDGVLETGAAVTFEHELEARGRVLQCQAFPIGDEPKDQVGVTVQDITDRVERERRLEESNERLEQFAYAASHDLQEPLRMVSSYLRLLDGRYATELDADGREFLGYAVDGADRMRAMIDGLLEYSRIETKGNPFEPVNLNAVLADARADLRVKLEESDADIVVEDLPRVEGDASQLRQVFQNLLENAVEYAGDEPPRISVAAERYEPRPDGDEERSGRGAAGVRPADRERGHGSRTATPPGLRADGTAAAIDGTAWVLSVRDEGIGIDPDHADRVFQVFERLHTHDEYPGTGIGLALCERIVERHGGTMWVDSEPGEGATFRFTLPAAASGD